MKMTFLAKWLVPATTAFLLSGCATQGDLGVKRDAEHSAHHRGTVSSTSSPTRASTHSGSVSRDQGGTMPMMDMASMCDMHKSMMSAKSPAERDAMMDQHMKSMPPEARRKHMEMMQSKCK